MDSGATTAINGQTIELSTFKEAFYAAPIGVALVAPNGSWIEVNDILPSIVGYSKQELTNMTFQDITHPDDLEKDLDFVQQMLDRKIKNYKMEKRYLHKDGNVVWVLLSVTLVWDKQDQPKYFISQILDISELKKVTLELETKITELKRINQLMTDRELKMVELKKKLADCPEAQKVLNEA